MNQCFDGGPILILGANSRLARAFMRQNCDIFSFRAIARAPCRVRQEANNFIVRDSYVDLNPELFCGCRAVINFTGVSRGDLRINVEIPVEAARTSRRMGVPHFVQISSLSVYGGIENVDLDTAENPQSAYGMSKYQADRQLQALATDSFGVTLLRVPILYGDGGENKIHAVARLMARLGNFPVTSPQAQRSVLHLSNAAAVLRQIIQAPLFGIQLAADREPFNFNELSAAICAVRGAPIRLRRVPQWMLLPVALVLPNVYRSVWLSSLIKPEDSVAAQIPLPVSLQDGLRDLIERIED